MKDVTCLPFRWIWNVVNYFFQLGYRYPWGARLLSSTFLLFGFCGGSGADSYFLWSVLFHCWHLVRWIQVQFYFSSGSWGFWMNFKFLCTIFSGFIYERAIAFLKSWWDNLRLLGVPCMLLMNYYIMYAFVRITPTPQKKMYHHHFLFLTQKAVL